MSWICPACKLNNFAGNVACADKTCNYLRPSTINGDAIDVDWIRLTSYTANGWLERGKQKMAAATESEVDKFTLFFNKGCSSANATATIEELDIKIKELEEICLEGKATLQGYQKVRRERVEKLSKTERDKLITNAGINVVDSDSLIKKRVERISKADRLKASLAGLELDDDLVKELMGNVKVNENMQAIGNDTSKISFNKPAAVANETVTVDSKVEVNVEVKKEESKPSFLDGLFK